MDKFRGSGSQKEWQASCLFRPEGLQQRHPEGKLPPTDDRGNRNPTAWCQSFRPTGCVQRVLARKTIGRVVLLDNVSHSFRQIPLERDAIRYILSARSFPGEDARVCVRLGWHRSRR